MAHLVAIDRESKQWKASVEGTFSFFSDEALLDGKFFEYYEAILSERILLVEKCHFDPRYKRSVSQVYSHDQLLELLKLARSCGWKILAFPQKQTPRAREESGLEKVDDCWAIEQFYFNHPEIPMLVWNGPPTEQDKAIHDRRNDMRADMAFRLNVMRPDYDDPQVDHARELLYRSYDRISPETREWFGLKLVYAGKPRERLDFSEMRVMSIYVAVYEANGRLRLNDKGEFIGFREARASLWMQPYHGRGKTARSNLIFHCLSKTETRRVGKNTRDPETRRSFGRAVNEMIKVLRDAGSYVQGGGSSHLAA